MIRAEKTLFGRFRDRLSTAVFADGWWFFHASGVELEGEGRVSHDLAALLPESAAKALRPLPAQVDIAWFKSVAPVGLQVQANVVEDSPLELGLVACRVDDTRHMGGVSEDIAYPLALSERQGQIVLQFSALGPSPELQTQIVVAFGQRLLW